MKKEEPFMKSRAICCCFMIVVFYFIFINMAIAIPGLDELNVRIVVRQQSKRVPHCSITIFAENDSFVKEVITNRNGEIETTLAPGNYYFSAINDDKVTADTGHIAISEAGIKKVEINLPSKKLWEYVVNKDFLNVLFGIGIAYIFFVMRSLRFKKLFYSLILNNFFQEQVKFIKILNTLEKTNAILTPVDARKFYEGLTTSLQACTKLLEEIKTKYLSMLAGEGHGNLRVILKNENIIKQWKVVLALPGEESQDNEIHEIIANVSRELNNSDNSQISTLMKATKRRYLINKVLISYSHIFPI